MATNQIVSTPADLISAVEKRFGRISWDLAANAENYKSHSKWRYFGPGSPIEESAFMRDWEALGDLAWLNPPFADIEPWAERCASSVLQHRQRIALLIPASVCTGYFIEHVKRYAYVFELTPRPFKKEVRDCILALYEPSLYTGRETWNWRNE